MSERGERGRGGRDKERVRRRVCRSGPRNSASSTAVTKAAGLCEMIMCTAWVSKRGGMGE